MSMKDLADIDTSLKQIVDKPTRGSNILDIALTNLHSWYNEVVILPPLKPDIPNNGVQSDHHGILLKPKM